MGERGRVYARFLLVFALLGGVGVATTLYVLIMERAPVPLQDVFTVRAEFAEAGGVVAGIGQPVNIVGVKVGKVVDAKVRNGRALVTLQLQRDKVPHLYANATASLEPITPLKDMQVNLDPGTKSSAVLATGATLSVARTNQPVPLSDLLSTLDGDTRDYVSSLITSMDQGLAGRGQDMRKMLVAMGPTTAQVGRISRSLADRRRSLARLMHNLALVTRAASRDSQLAAVVDAGNATLEALAQQDKPLREAVSKLPPTLRVAEKTLVDIKPFAQQLEPTLSALRPTLRGLPTTLRDLRQFADVGTPALKNQIRPLVRSAQPLARDAGPAVTQLAATTPKLTRSFQTLKYLTNELAYNPPGDDEGFLFWLAWAGHNVDSVISMSDAHGGLGRAVPTLACKPYIPDSIAQAVGLGGLCP